MFSVDASTNNLKKDMSKFAMHVLKFVENITTRQYKQWL